MPRPGSRRLSVATCHRFAHIENTMFSIQSCFIVFVDTGTLRSSILAKDLIQKAACTRSLVDISLSTLKMTRIVKPVREFLRTANDDDEHDTLSSWIFLDRRRGNGNTSRVACSSKGLARSTTQARLGARNTGVNEGQLVTIMGFPPLKEAFGEYCQRALCSEVQYTTGAYACVNQPQIPQIVSTLLCVARFV